MSDQEQHRGDEGLALEEARPELKEPSMYKVVLLNDDYTPMEFVVTLLEQLFGLDREQATRIMLLIHTQGKGICGVFTYEIAAGKIFPLFLFKARHQHPLMCSMEEA